MCRIHRLDDRTVDARVSCTGVYWRSGV